MRDENQMLKIQIPNSYIAPRMKIWAFCERLRQVETCGWRAGTGASKIWNTRAHSGMVGCGLNDVMSHYRHFSTNFTMCSGGE